jgi:5,10-methenyltetrahydrofolate synthetase
MKKIHSDSRKKNLRKTLLNLRDSLTTPVKLEADKKISKCLNTLLIECKGPIAFYWPMRNEYDPIAVVSTWLMTKERQAALPVIIEKSSPMKFLNWNKTTVLKKGIFNLPVPPISSNEINPSTIIIPCVGFDSKNYRLGYGGGYYDRTLAIFSNAKKIGICYESCRIENLEPNEYDIPMDLIVCS